jgi:sulfatase modifying factor 1
MKHDLEHKGRRAVIAGLAAASWIGACAARPQTVEPPPSPAEVEPPTASEPAISKVDAGAPGSGPESKEDTAVRPPSEDRSATACPSNMKLVEGTYCTDVEHKCLKSWYDESNKKTVCEEFEPKAVCSGQKVKKRFCIDSYAWPNQKGERPEVMNRFHQAQLKCAAIGKRMCTESEWTMACEGPEMKPFPYGYVRDTKKCHGDMLWDGPDMQKVAQRDATELARLWKGVRSGSQPQCISDYGVADLPGNNDEVVASEQFGGDWKAKYDSVHTGGPWYKGVRNQCRPKIYTHDEGFYYYFLGFRCCAEPDGQPTNPLTPKQQKAGWKLDRVERVAGFSLEQIKKKLELKKQGKCSCGDKDITCKTMCGTLLGPGAKDYK